ncbi:RES family NAD+ phosphorylase [Marinobacter salsuginis]|uniref:RES domain-containing protein n=1 Tax=Marinobacter salsuginis TaxID=418719 RepID=A0A5M3Q256_9GAMM|nr:RES family NAD+ phosphorylase [Marinobacter salsuginis]GBO89139.1 hypothetical protein MSSD14B_28070 [Marinobacter salsuginis]
MTLVERVEKAIEPVRGRLFRVAESQEQVATTEIVDSAAEQSRLEELLEDSKPAYPEPVDDLHYLLKTPFRYPPLMWGSRFGGTFEPSLFYGAARTETALVETAFYRFVFVTDPEEPFPKPVKSQHTIFEVDIASKRGVKLQSDAWNDLHPDLVHPKDYRFTQDVGSAMRAAGVEAFQFISARAVQAGIREIDDRPAVPGIRDLWAELRGVNWALFTPRAFEKTRPTNLRPMIAVTTREKVSIVVTEPDGSSKAVEYPVELFLVEGEIPRPAA